MKRWLELIASILVAWALALGAPADKLGIRLGPHRERVVRLAKAGA